MKKFFVMFLVMALLCGCGQAPEASKTATTSPTETTPPEEITEVATIAITEDVIEAETEHLEEKADDVLLDIDHILHYEKDIVPTFKAAAEFATVVYKYLEKPEGTENYTVIDAMGIGSDLRFAIVFFGDGGTIDQIWNGEIDFCCIILDMRTGRVCSVEHITAEEMTERNQQLQQYEQQTENEDMSAAD